MKRYAIGFLNALWIYPLRSILILLTHILYRPKIYYESAASPRRRVKTPTVITCNHLRGADGAVISTIFVRKRIHPLAAKRWYSSFGCITTYLLFTVISSVLTFTVSS